MKLTKSQRLFIKVGEALAFEKYWRSTHAMGITAKHVPSAIAAYKRRKKKLIREALLVYGEELDEAWHEGLSTGVDYTI